MKALEVRAGTENQRVSRLGQGLPPFGGPFLKMSLTKGRRHQRSRGGGGLRKTPPLNCTHSVGIWVLDHRGYP